MFVLFTLLLFDIKYLVVVEADKVKDKLYTWRKNGGIATAFETEVGIWDHR